MKTTSTSNINQSHAFGMHRGLQGILAIALLTLQACGGSETQNVATIAAPTSTQSFAAMSQNEIPQEDLILWLDASDQASLFQDTDCTESVTGIGQEVACWKDKSGNDSHVLEDEYLFTPDYQIDPHTGLGRLHFERDEEEALVFVHEEPFTTDFTAFFVLQANDAPRDQDAVFSNSDYANPDNSNIRVGYNGDMQYHYPGSRGKNMELTYGAASAGVHLLAVSNGYSFVSSYHNGALIETVLPDLQGIGTLGTRGRTFEQYRINTDSDSYGFMEADYAEVRIYNRVLSDCEREQVNYELAGKYKQDFIGLTNHYGFAQNYGNDITGTGLALASCEASVAITLAESGGLEFQVSQPTTMATTAIAFGHSGGSFSPYLNTLEAPAGYAARVQRSWRVATKGATEVTGTISIDLGAMDFVWVTNAGYGLLIDTDDGDFSNATGIQASRIENGVLYFDNITIADGGFISVAVPVEDSDGVSLELEVLMGADPYSNDTDGDGVSDDIELAHADVGSDVDGDGLLNWNDADSDNNGINDFDEMQIVNNQPPATEINPIQPMNDDQDGDGIPNYLDQDDDGDGINDIDENSGANNASVDVDNDGIPNWMDNDANGNGILDSNEPSVDNDGDGIEDFLDTHNEDGPSGDLDGDGLDNAYEASIGTDPQNVDSDGDGLDDFVETNVAFVVDADGDGTINALDVDSDNDGQNDGQECGFGSSCLDTDNDGIPNYLDSDSDNDGYSDADENIYDLDNDGLSDAIESNTLDVDGDGLANNADVDSDGDGILDLFEGHGDLDGDGIPNILDAAGSVSDVGDSDADGLSDAMECSVGLPCPDTDFDRIPDYMDVDSDNDGVLDADEMDLDTDNDGVADSLESGNRDTEGDGFVDSNDSDSDNDGILDGQESMHVDHDKDRIPSMLDADSDAENSGDSDQDGIEDSIECSSGFPCVDSDLDLVPDYMDLDSNNDGILDSAISSPQSNQPLPNTDSDGDGIFDLIERQLGTDPGNADTDGDTISDKEELERGSNPLVDESSEDSQQEFGLYNYDNQGTGCSTTGGGSIFDLLLLCLPLVFRNKKVLG